MKKRTYKNLETVVQYFNKSIWNKLFDLSYFEEFGGYPDRIEVNGNKVIAYFNGYISDAIFCMEYNETLDIMQYTIPNRIWKPLLTSYGFIPKNPKVFYGKYKTSYGFYDGN